MQPEWQRAKEIFAAVIELDPSERTARLDSECGEDGVLRAEVERLLAYDNSEYFKAETRQQDGAQPRRVEPWMFSKGDVIGGRFEVLNRLGRGGMGEVYEVFDRNMGNRKALKAIRRELLNDPGARKQFREEIGAGQRVAHDNICHIHDLVVDDAGERPVLAYTMELVEGESLADYVKRRGPLRPEEALALIRQIAAGLQKLHREGITHRDLKPANVMMRRAFEGAEVKLTDFGLAQSIGGAAGTPREDDESVEIAGTVPYMSPEQLTGGETGFASDAYALGVVAYEMVTGEYPFKGKSIGQSWREKTRTKPIPPSALNPAVEKHWDRAILRSLAVSPAERPRVGAFVEELEGSANAGGLGELRHRVVRAYRGHPLAVHLALVVFFVALIAAAFRYRESRGSDGAAVVGEQHVAVLPFTAIGGDPQLQVFSDGLMETVTRRLSQFEGLNERLLVVPASEVRGQGVKTPTEALNKLGANYAVEGSVQAEGERVRLTFTIVDAVQTRQVETGLVEGLRTNTMALEDGAVDRLSVLLDLRIEPKHVGDATVDVLRAPGAHSFYVQGRSYLQRSDKTDNIHTAISLFERATSLDDRYAPAYAGMCDAYWNLYERTKEAAWVNRASDNCARALELNSQLPEVLVTLGRLHSGTGEYEAAIKDFRNALKANPRDGAAFEGLAHVYFLMDRFDEAEATYLKAISLRPSDWRVFQQLGSFYFKRGQYAKAIEPFRQVVALTPDNVLGYLTLGAALHGVGRLEEAEEMYNRSIEREPRSEAFTNLGMLQYGDGRYEEAAGHFAKAVELRPNNHRAWANLGDAYDRLGNVKAREAYLRAAVLVEQELQLNPKRTNLYTNIAHYYAGALDKERAAMWLHRAETRQNQTGEELVTNAATAARIGMVERALGLVKQALAGDYPPERLESSAWLAPVLRSPEYLIIEPKHKSKSEGNPTGKMQGGRYVQDR